MGRYTKCKDLFLAFCLVIVDNSFLDRDIKLENYPVYISTFFHIDFRNISWISPASEFIRNRFPSMNFVLDRVQDQRRFVDSIIRSMFEC